MSDGTDQRQRVPPILSVRPFRVDEVDFATRAAMQAALARHLRFVDLGGQDRGDWQRLFDNDESLVLARIAAIDLVALERQLTRDLEAAQPTPAVHVIALMAQQVDRWWKALAGNTQPAARAVCEQIEQAVALRLRGDLAWMLGHFGTLPWRGQPLTQAANGLSALWLTPGTGEPALRALPATADNTALRPIGFAFLSAICRLKHLAAELLPGSLPSGQHEPAAAMLMAFLKLYGTVQEGINRFAERHIDFYYRDCLGLRPAPARPDAQHLVCLREPRAAGEVLLPQGALFEAGKDANGRPIEFAGDHTLAVTEAAVAELYTLRQDRDAQISPERDFGFVTRIKAARLPVWPAASLPPASALPCHALFGGDRGACSAVSDARLGLAIATPVLRLAEGEREIRVRLRVSPDDGGRSLSSLVDDTVQATSLEARRERFGRVLVRWLIAGDVLAPDDLQRLRDAASSLPGAASVGPVDVDDALHLIQGEGTPSRGLLFSRLINGLFDFQLTTAQGWWTPTATDISPHPEGGLLFVIRLRREDPAIVDCDLTLHGAEWATRWPLLRLDVSTHGRLYPYSLLSSLHLHEATLGVRVSGLKDVLLRNQLGRLDPSRPCHPFGPLPTTSSYLVFGSTEIAAKHLVNLTVHLEWSGLPTLAGGFGEWYRGYAPTYIAGEPTASLAILRDGQWQDCTGALARQALFSTEPAHGRLLPLRALPFDPPSVRKHSRPNRPEPLDGPRVMGGLYRLRLMSPEGAFGHAAYPLVLADAVNRQARSRRPAPQPNPPYTPLLERLWLDYEAIDTIPLDRADGEAGAVDGIEPSRLYHLHPFGLKALRSTIVEGAQSLIPRLDHDGHLLIGIAAAALDGPLSLLFHLREADAADSAGTAAPVRTLWSFLKSGVWHPLSPVHVLSDSTMGFLTTGIVTLDLPKGLDTRHDVMPSGLFWLRLSADHGFSRFAGLHGVHAQSARVTRVLPTAPPAPLSAPLAAVGQIEPRRSVAGLAGVVPVGALRGGRIEQDRVGFYASAGERLQHKRRASNPWDYERLVLERFPGVAKVKCFAAQSGHGAAPAPGHVRVVVVPEVPRNVHDLATTAPRLAAHELREIHAFLAAHASPWVRLQVRNAGYERIQVRCVIQTRRGTHQGVVLRRARRAIIDHLSPWIDGGCQAQFDWQLRCEDIQAPLRAVEGVQAVVRLSLLRTACDDEGQHTLGDTARPVPGEQAPQPCLRPLKPWNLALPMIDHLITAEDATHDIAPIATGLQDLAIGSTFIIGGVAS